MSENTSAAFPALPGNSSPPEMVRSQLLPVKEPVKNAFLLGYANEACGIIEYSKRKVNRFFLGRINGDNIRRITPTAEWVYLNESN